MLEKIKTGLYSEIGKLEGVIVHTPGREVEEMTPENAERALYSDILNLSVAGREYAQLKGILNKITRTFEVKDLLADILKNDQVRNSLLQEICRKENALKILPVLMELEAEETARQLIQGVPLKRDNLTNYLSAERFSLRPLHNFLFTRDASMGFYDQVLIGKMASSVRDREPIIMNAIFTHHPLINTRIIDPSYNDFSENIFIEGGDFLVAREDVLVVGTGIRTSTQGIDFIIEQLKSDTQRSYHLLVQELPHTPESFIHLDMVFTFLDHDACMIYEPLILGTTRFHTIHIKIENGRVVSIREQKNLLSALKKLGINLKPVTCGGSKDAWTQEREQWHSGANFFAFAPGQVIGYERNEHTIEEMDKNGFEIIRAEDLLNGKASIPNRRCAITIAGSELARGGGGARCMTMPFKRQTVEW
ncbi:MAG: arginine deiminase family protein [Prolixibacteraceae bacterium]|jgi:arginine deiminase|nr:arginine deiminase family protein [Prolixibacteraceae bacterium]